MKSPSQAGQVLAGRGPAVVDEHGPLGPEDRGRELQPPRPQLGVDGLHQGAGRPGLVGRRGVVGLRLVQAQGGQDVAGRGGQHALLPGDGGGEGVQGGRVDDGAARPSPGEFWAKIFE